MLEYLQGPSVLGGLNLDRPRRSAELLSRKPARKDIVISKSQQQELFQSFLASLDQKCSQKAAEPSSQASTASDLGSLDQALQDLDLPTMPSPWLENETNVESEQMLEGCDAPPLPTLLLRSPRKEIGDNSKRYGSSVVDSPPPGIWDSKLQQEYVSIVSQSKGKWQLPAAWKPEEAAQDYEMWSGSSWQAQADALGTLAAMDWAVNVADPQGVHAQADGGQELPQGQLAENFSIETQFSQAQVAPPPGLDMPPTTTMMICDIPSSQSIDDVIEVIDMNGFGYTYDLVHMPVNIPKGRRTHNQTMKAAFVNFKHAGYAAAFERAFHKITFPQQGSRQRSKKMSWAKPSHCQGYDANMVLSLAADLPGELRTFA